jgi:geranylgeranyl pyrophosphate synthase
MLTEYAVDDPRATEELYLEMLTKKTSVLVGASARVAGMAAEVTAEEEEKLWQYGLSLGIAYQMYDDLASIWGSTDATGKEAHGDIREKKKTLPILYAVKKLPEAEKNELVSLYNTSGSLDDTAVARVIELLNSVDAYTHVRALVDHHKDAALAIVSTLSVSENGARTLSDLVKALLPEARST